MTIGRGSLCLVLALAAVPAQSRPSRDTSWLPLETGAMWIYRDSVGESRLTCLGAEIVDGERGYRMARAGRSSEQVEVWRVRPNAIVFERAASDSRAARKELALVLPAGAGAVWEADLLRSERAPTDISARAEIESMHESVSVPAGTFDSVRVRIVRDTPMEPASETTLWFARGVGIVQRVEIAGASRAVHELTGYVPPSGKPDADLERILAIAFPSDPLLGDRPRMTQIRGFQLSTWFESRFVRFEIGGRVTFLREHLGTVTPFDLCRLDDWQRVMVDERLHGDPGNRLPTVVALLVAARLGGTPVVAARDDGQKAWELHNRKEGRDVTEVHGDAAAVDEQGRRQWRRATLTYVGKELTQVIVN